MFTTALYFIPCIISFLWFVLFLFRKKDWSQILLTWIMGLAALHYICTATFISPNTDYKWVCRLDIVCQPLVLCILALCIIYIRSHLGEKMSKAKMQIYFLPAIIHGAAIWLLYLILGFDNVVRFARTSSELGGELSMHGRKLFEVLPAEFNTKLYFLFHKFDVAVSNIWCAFMAVLLILSCVKVSKKYGYKFGDSIRFWFKGAATCSERAISYWMMIIILGECPFIFVGRKFVYHHPALGCAMAIVISIGVFFMCYCEFLNHRNSITLYNFTHTEMHSYALSYRDDMPQKWSAEENDFQTNEISKGKESKDINTLFGSAATETGGITPALRSRTEEKNNNIAIELRHLLEEEQIFTDKNLTLEVLAKRMNTNRNKLSTIVNQLYGMEFRNVLARLRIEEAKNFMRINPTATTETIAMHCGFKDTSAFFHRFKDIVGESPRMWISK